MVMAKSTHLFRKYHNHESGLPEPHSRSGIVNLVFADDGLCNKLGEVSTPTIQFPDNDSLPAGQ